jgi:hypothetical protein
MSLISDFFLYATIFWLAIIAVGMLSVVLGYRLFTAGTSSKEAAIGAKTVGLEFILKNSAPGTFFALFGVIIISVMLVEGNPELVLKSLSHTSEQSLAMLPSGGEETAQRAAGVPNSAEVPPAHTGNQPAGRSIWTQVVLTGIIPLFAAVCSLYFFFKNRDLSKGIANRTVTFEAQKLLVEINKQFIADPSLFAIYDDIQENKKALDSSRRLKDKVRALGYMKLNVFEIVFSVVPDVSEDGPWKAYFLDSLDRCSVLADEIKTFKAIYHCRLVEEYEEWVNDTEGRKRRETVRSQRISQPEAAWIDPVYDDCRHGKQRIEALGSFPEHAESA